MARIGLIGLAALEHELVAAGHEVFGAIGSGPAESIGEIRAARSEGGLDALLVADVLFTGGPSYIARQHKSGERVLIVRGVEGAMPTLAVPSVQLPLSINDLMAAAGLPPFEGGDISVVVRDGAVDLDMFGSDEPELDIEPEAPVLYATVAAPAMPVAPAPAPSLPQTVAAPAMPVAPPPPPVLPALPVTVAAPALPVAPSPAPALPQTVAAPAMPVASVPAPSSFEDLIATQTAIVPYVREMERDHRSALGQVIFVVAGKGGARKTSTALLVAQAAGLAGLRSVAGDMNRGQADIATKLLARGLPTIADAVLGDPSDLSTYVSSPEAIAAAQAQTQRGRNAGTPIACSVVFGPATEEHASPNFVTAALYRRVIDALAREFDIVVVDTQTAEMWDTSGLFDGVVRPMMAQRQAWLLGVTPLDGPSIKNLGARYTKWREAGSLPADRVITVLGSSARENGASAHDPEQVASAFARFGFVAGCIPYSEEVEHAFENGSIPAASAAVRPVMHAVLFRVTGLATFAPPDDAEGSKRSRRQKGSKRRIFRRKG